MYSNAIYFFVICHSRESGNPDSSYSQGLDSRFRGNDNERCDTKKNLYYSSTLMRYFTRLNEVDKNIFERSLLWRHALYRPTGGAEQVERVV